VEPTTQESTNKLDAPEVGKLIENFPFADYKNSEGINSSGLKHILRSPAHYYEYRYNRIEEKDSEALIFGSLFHYAILEPELFRQRYLVQPNIDLRTNVGKEFKKSWEKTYLRPDSILVPEKFSEKLKIMVDKMLGNTRVRNLLEKGVRETTIFWDDQKTGDRCKGRLDFISSLGHVVDIKTSKDASEEAFMKAIWNYKYYIQVAHYLEAGRVTKAYDPNHFVFVVIEKDPPYEIALYEADNSVMGVGDQWRTKAMEIYSKCKKENRWPGYTQTFTKIGLPRYAEGVDPDDFGF
jgi:PDDEXK-like domain of unknown function (DUF3799)